MKWIYSVPLLLSLHLWGSEPRLSITRTWDQTVEISELISLWQSSSIIVWVMHRWHFCDSQSFVTLNPFSVYTRRKEGRGLRLQKLLTGRDETCFTATRTHLSCVKEEQTRTRMKASLYTQVPPLWSSAEAGGSHWGWREAGGFNAAADQRARRAQSGSDSSQLSCFLGPAVSISAPGTLQGLKTACVTADMLVTATFLEETVVSHRHTQPGL